MLTIEQLFAKYLELIRTAGPVECGDLVRHLDDATCKQLFDKLAAHPTARNMIVKPLYYNYTTQAFRWEFK